MTALTPKGVPMNTSTKSAESFVDEELATNIDSLRAISQQHPHITLHIATEVFSGCSHTQTQRRTWVPRSHGFLLTMQPQNR